MKKLLALILTVLMLMSVVACDSETQSDNGTNSSQSQNKNSKEITFDGLVAIDNAECTVKVTEIDPDNMWGYTLKVQLENKSDDKTYMFSVQDAAINGVQCDPFFATEVAAGKKSNEQISFTKGELDKNGIKDYTDIELSFRVYDSDDWMSDDVAKETVHIYPYGEENATKFVRTSQTTDTVLVDNEYVTVIVTGYENDDVWGYTAKLFLLNKTDKNVMFSVDEASVNGYMADPFFATSVSSGKCAFSSMSWSDSTLEENGITDVEEIEFNLRVYDEDNWLSDDLVNKTVTLIP
ncbi:MAG: hypothetical protein E7582_06450 [Ruminococcaceae bacterium]|nr:hypothetical protein [Oscillospiraceae bacterium]